MSAFKCPSCKIPNASNARFCTNCGNSLMQAQAAATPYETPHSQPAPSMVAEFAFAGFWKRAIAYIFDGIIFSILLTIIFLIFGSSMINMNNPQAMLNMGVTFIIGFYISIYVGWWLYFAILESSSLQATLGKKMMGIKVTDMQGQPLSFMHATGRHFSGFVTQMTFFIGFLMIAFTSRKQALHDKMASTLVVNKRYDANQIRIASENPAPGMSVGGIIAVVFLVLLVPVGGILAAIAIPAYADYAIRANVDKAINETRKIQTAIIDHATETGYWPNTIQQAGVDEQQLLSDLYQIRIMSNGSYQIIFKRPEGIANRRLDFSPELTPSGDYHWRCSSEDMKNAYLPSRCRTN